jgi:sugar/nucleoside kinase (ribokinase family)
MIRDEFVAEGLPAAFLEVEDRPLAGVSVSFNLDGDRGFVTHWGAGHADDAKLDARAREVASQVDARHLHIYVDDNPELEALGLADGQMRVVPADTAEVVDATGAGDCFNAGFLVGWLGELALEASLALGVICGSRAVGDYGGYRGCPREPGLRAIAASRGITLPSRRAISEGDPP